MHDPEARVFLATGSDYAGVRGAYHLFPRNVFWRRGGPELPDPSYIHTGDYILVYSARDVRFDASSKTLHWSGQHGLKVQTVFLEKEGGLFRAE